MALLRPQASLHCRALSPPTETLAYSIYFAAVFRRCFLKVLLTSRLRGLLRMLRQSNTCCNNWMRHGPRVRALQVKTAGGDKSYIQEPPPGGSTTFIYYPA